MKEESYPFKSIARKIGISPDDAECATTLFIKWLAERVRNYDRGNRDFIGEELHWLVNRSTFYHLLGFLDVFSDRYSWEMGIAKEYLLRIAPRDEWPNYLDEPSEDKPPNASTFATSMIGVCMLSEGARFDIGLVICANNSRLYARIRLKEEIFPECDKYSRLDYVPLTPEELASLIGLDSQEMLLGIQRISVEKDCIVTIDGKAQWEDRVDYSGS